MRLVHVGDDGQGHEPAFLPDALRMRVMASGILMDNPVLARFRKALDAMYGGRIDRVVLFGSRAHGDARPDSDYDVAVFLHAMADRAAETNRLADLGTDISDETGEFVHAMPYRAGSEADPTPLMLGIRTGGVDL